eukprot:gene12426-12562_t
MDPDCCSLASQLVSGSYINQGAAALAARKKQVKALLSNRRLPQHGWDEATIQLLLQDLALMDSNNFPGQVGLGEREGRVACPLVAAAHGRLAHGIGRSGDITAEQPKAAGSSVLAKLSADLAADALRLAGLADLGPAVKTCLKSITAANLVPVVVELLRHGDELVTDVAGIAAAIEQLGTASVAAVVTTTSCFAPRVLTAAVTAACRRGRVDAIVQSTDKNFMVPVGGAVITAPAGREGAWGFNRGWLIDAVAKNYPGRASMTAHWDLLVTLLYWGVAGWTEKLQQREELFEYLKQKLAAAAAEYCPLSWLLPLMRPLL